MNIIDIILIVPIVWFAYQGFRKGFIIELASLVALILGIYAALYFSGYASDFLKNNLNLSGEYLPVLSFILTLVVVVVFVYMIGKILEKFIDIIALGFLNKLAGIFFGVLKGAVIISIVLLIINHFNEKLISTEKKQESFLYGPISVIAPMLWHSFENLNIQEPGIEDLKEDFDQV